MIYRFHPEAAEELLEACTYYSEISNDLAHAFYTRFEEGIEKMHMSRQPGYWRDRLKSR